MPEETPAPPPLVRDASPDAEPARRVWLRTLAAAWFAQIVAIMGFSFVMPFMRLYLRDELGVVEDSSRAYWAAFVISAPGFVMVFAAPLWGALADRVGRKPMVMRAMFAGAAVIALMGFARTPSELLALRLVQGTLTGTVTASAALVASVTPSHRAGLSLGVMQAAIFLGNAAGSLGGGVVFDRFGGRAAFLAAGGLLLAGGIVVTLFAEEGSAHPREARRAGATGSTDGLVDVLRSPAFLVIVGLMFVMNFSRGFPGAIFQEYVELFVEDKARLNTMVGLLHSVTFAVAGATSVAMGRLADRVGHGPLVVAGTIMSGVLCIPQAWIGSLAGLFALRVLLGVAAGTIGPAMGRFVHTTIPRASHGKAFGLFQSAGSCGWAAGPLAGGLMNALLIGPVGTGTALRLPFAAAGVFQLAVGLGAWCLFARGACRAPLAADFETHLTDPGTSSQ